MNSVYYIKKDADEYVIDATAVPTPLSDYSAILIKEPIKAEHLRGYYKLIDGMFVVDDNKRAEWMSINMPQEDPDA